MSSRVLHVESTDAAEDLAHLLNSGNRRRPAAVVTIPAARLEPWIDVQEIANEVGDVVDVYLMPTGAISRAFAAEMAPMTQVYGGAGRVYPIGGAWVADVTKSPLRMAFNAADGAVAARKLVADALTMAKSAGLVGASSPASPAQQTAPAMVEVSTDSQARQLAKHLLDPRRTRPVLAASLPNEADACAVDVDRIVDEVSGLIDIRVITTMAASWAFKREMPTQTEVYGGAGRVYPVGTDWTTNLGRSPLRLARTSQEAKRSTEQLIDDATTTAFSAGLLETSTATAPRRDTAFAGTVTGFPTAGRAWIAGDDRRLATVAEELTVPEVSLDRILAVGMRVTGTRDEAGRLDITAMLRGADVLDYQPGDVVLARVDETSPESAVLSLHPDVQVQVRRSEVTTNELDSVDDLLTVGEVLRARVCSRDPWRLRLDDIDDDEDARDPVALIHGGPGWLVEGLPEVEVEPEFEAPAPFVVPEHYEVDRALEPVVEPATPAVPTPAVPAPAAFRPTPAILDRNRAKPPVESTPTPATPTPAPAVPAAPKPGPRPTGQPAQPTPPADRSPQPAAGKGLVESLQLHIATLKAKVREQDETIAALFDERALLEEDLHKQRRAARDLESRMGHQRVELRKSKRRNARDSGASQAPLTDLFDDTEEQLRFEITCAWVRRIPRQDKARLRLPDYLIGPDFASSLDQLQGVSRDKALDVIVEVLTGLANHLGSREVHQLRVSDVGGSPQRTRPDGAKAWRASLQSNTPGARRLHYWITPDQTIELARVGHHDDYEI